MLEDKHASCQRVHVDPSPPVSRVECRCAAIEVALGRVADRAVQVEVDGEERNLFVVGCGIAAVAMTWFFFRMLVKSFKATRFQFSA